MPLLFALGSCLPDMIVPGHMDSLRGLLVCRENLPRLRALLPEGWLPAGEYLPAHRLIGGYQYTRVDPAARLARDAVDDGKTTQMIYAGQTVVPGAVFVHGFTLRDALQVDLGAVLWSLELWNRNVQTVGGMAAKGHGRLLTLARVEPAVDRQAAIGAYVAHTTAAADDIRAIMAEEFGGKK